MTLLLILTPLLVYLIHLNRLIHWTLLSREKCVAIASLAGVTSAAAEYLFAADVLIYLEARGLTFFAPSDYMSSDIVAGFTLLVIAIVRGVWWAREGPP
jgi:hypothetical protein